MYVLLIRILNLRSNIVLIVDYDVCVLSYVLCSAHTSDGRRVRCLTPTHVITLHSIN